MLLFGGEYFHNFILCRKVVQIRVIDILLIFDFLRKDSKMSSEFGMVLLF